MAKAPTKSDASEDVEKANAAERLARNDMEPQVSVWRDAQSAIRNKLPITDQYMPNITVGRLAADMETIVSRDVQTLMGEIPYMPYEALDKQNPDAVEHAAAITEQGQFYAEKGDLYTRFADLMRMVRPLGIAYIEPRHSLTPVAITREDIQFDRFGRATGTEKHKEDTVTEGYDFRVLEPWVVRPHPFGNTLDSKSEVCVCELVHVDEIKRLLDMPESHYKLPDDVSEEDLENSMPDSGDWNTQLRRDKGSLAGDAMSKIGFLIRYYSDGKWIHTWNRNILLMSTDNQNENMPKFKKPFAAFRNMSHITADRYWPRGDYEFMMDLYWLGDMWLNLYAHAAQMYGAQWILYDPGAGIRPEDLKAYGGARIPVEGGEFDKKIQTMSTGTPPKEYLEFYHETKEIADNRLHVNDFVAGRTPDRKETATAVDALVEAGLSAMEFGITYVERGGFTDLAVLLNKSIANHQTDAQRARILGQERADRLRSSDADSIPGGFTMAFRGSAGVRRRQRKMQKALEAYNLVRNQPTIINPWVMDREILETMEVWPSQVLDDMGLTADQQADYQAFLEFQKTQGMAQIPGAESVGATTAVENPANVGAGLAAA